jgi:arsenate reductase
VPDQTYNVLFVNLPLRSIDRLSLGTKLREIGRSAGTTSSRDDVA